MKLTKKQAFDLIPSILDGEATETESLAFFEYIEKDDAVRKQFESQKIIKELVRDNCKREKAPDHLKNKITELITDMEWEENSSSKVDNSPNSVKSDAQDINNYSASNKHVIYKLFKPLRYVAAAAVILFFSLITIELLERTSTSQLPVSQSLEEIVFIHFQNSDDFTGVLTSVTPEDINHASEYLEAEFSYFPRMPLFDGAEITQVLHSSLTDELNTPVLKFHQKDIDENIYVFAFKLDDLEQQRSIKRDPEAVKHCQTYDDYHIREVNGKHVVSWKWGEYWYAAVSNHNGNDVIAMVEPMEEESSGW
jgi:transcriptional regulator NrdR family protein